MTVFLMVTNRMRFVSCTKDPVEIKVAAEVTLYELYFTWEFAQVEPNNCEALQIGSQPN